MRKQPAPAPNPEPTETCICFICTPFIIHGCKTSIIEAKYLLGHILLAPSTSAGFGLYDAVDETWPYEEEEGGEEGYVIMIMIW